MGLSEIWTPDLALPAPVMQLLTTIYPGRYYTYRSSGLHRPLAARGLSFLPYWSGYSTWDNFSQNVRIGWPMMREKAYTEGWGKSPNFAAQVFITVVPVVMKIDASIHVPVSIPVCSWRGF